MALNKGAFLRARLLFCSLLLLCSSASTPADVQVGQLAQREKTKKNMLRASASHAAGDVPPTPKASAVQEILPLPAVSSPQSATISPLRAAARTLLGLSMIASVGGFIVLLLIACAQLLKIRTASMENRSSSWPRRGGPHDGNDV
jgi:hypothetical protein